MKPVMFIENDLSCEKFPSIQSKLLFFNNGRKTLYVLTSPFEDQLFIGARILSMFFNILVINVSVGNSPNSK